MQEIERFTPETLDEAAALLMAADAPWPPQAEGTRLVLQVTGSQPPSTFVIDLVRIPELNRLDYDERGGLRIGAALSSRSILEFPPVNLEYPILADACAKNPEDEAERFTFGVILGNARASAEIAPSLICLRASAAIFGPHDWSEIGIEALLTGSGKARIQPGEFVVDVRIPAPPPRSGGAYLRPCGQAATDPPAAGIGAFVVMEEDLVTCCGARLVLGGTAGTTALRALEAERFLAGKRLNATVVQEAATLAVRSVRPEGIDNAMTNGRLHAIGESVGRAILGALGRVHKATAT